jgi:dihydrolipoamide dehydrogenase
MKYDIIIIGSGPAGYVAAIRAGQVGLKTAIIEMEEIGGMCLNWGCMPSKSLIESAKLYRRILEDASKFGIEGIDKKALSFNYSKAVKRAEGVVKRLTKGVEFLLKKNGVEIIKGIASITSNHTVSADNRSFEADHILIATGSKSPVIESKEKDLVIDIKNLFTEREIPQNMMIIGNDSVAVELAQFFSMIDRNVTLAVPGDKVMPLADDYLSKYMEGLFKKEKINIIYNADINTTSNYKAGEFEINGQKVKCDALINAKNRVGIIPEQKVGLAIENGFIKTDEHCRTNIENIFAVGDVNGKSHFAHIGSAQGLHVVNFIKGIHQPLDIKKYPLNMYSVPEMAQIGFTEKELKDEGFDYKESIFPLSANGKAMTEGNNEGFIRILSENKYGEVLGVQIVAPHATDMIAEAAAFMQLESTIYDVAQTVHAHPTVSEIFMEAGFEGIDGAIHK